MFKNKLNYVLINILILMLVLYIGVSTIGVWGNIIGYILGIIFPFIVSFAIAYALHPFVKKLERKGVRKGLAVFLIVFIVIAILGVVLLVSVPMIYDQVVLFSKNIIQALQDIASKFDWNLGSFQAQITNALNQIISKLGGILSQGTIDFLGKSVGILGNFAVVSVLAIYFLSDMDKIRKKIKKFLKKLNNRSFEYVQALDNELGRYLNGLTLFMLIQLVEYSLVYRLVGHPNWLLLGILASITCVVPYFGGLVTNLIGVITASVVSTPVFIGTLIICLIFPQVDGYFTTPKIYGKTNNINPIFTILAVTIGGAIGGIIGIIIALPTFILLSCTYKFFEKDIKNKFTKVKENI